MTRAMLFACVLAAFLPAACGPEFPTPATDQKAVPDGPPPVADERAVYEAFFTARGGKPNSPVYAVATTDAAWFAEHPFRAKEWTPPYLDDLGGVPIELVEELYRLNRTSAPIVADPALGNVELLPADYEPPESSHYDNNRRCWEGEDWWQSWQDPDSECYFQVYFTVSRVAFSRDRRHALLKYLRHCRPLCGSEGFVAFEWDGQRWHEIGTRVLWIS
jgi:hypothetical protein